MPELVPTLLRATTVRRVLAALLLVAAVVVAARPSTEIDLVVAARALPPGVALADGDVVMIKGPPSLRSLTSPAQARGRVPTGPIGAGEPITELRLFGPETTAAAAGPDAAVVPVRVAEPGVVALLRPGARVDVLAAGKDVHHPAVLARDASVVSVRPGAEGDLALLALPREAATEVAAAALTRAVALTLR
ncbi:SAF domain-containing protein [Actinokineospora auranticolor]|uniref:Flp pilus assembly protein CpaB n=1 Tax=Actinokineospora auranticolor TaxID=155976 RepID=A0A2S6GYS8_9PSEU|nr:SAF domain-containing protein [Actinokineospora auranticolor]PPK70383.1 Flp pilus assembly protein CpaB [Actinokineospora auranticolor]